MSAAGDGSGSTPPTPIASTASPVPPISPFLTPAAAAAGVRYPLYIQGLYSPAAAIFGQTVLPWRSISTQLSGSSSPTTVTSNVMQSPSSAGTAASPQQTAAQQLVNVPNLTSITQLPGLVYPLTMPTVLTAQSNSVSGSGEAKKLSGPSITTLKRHSDGTITGDSDVKRPRLSDGSMTPHSPSLTSSSSSHPSTPTQLYKQPTHSQRSPVIKFIPYNPVPGPSVLLPSSTSQPTPIVIPQNVNLTQQPAALLAGANPTPNKATPTAVAVAAAPGGGGAAQLQHTYTIQHLPSTNSTSSPGPVVALQRLASGGSSSGGPGLAVGAGGLNRVGGRGATGSGVVAATTTSGSLASFGSLPYGRRIILLKCFGPLPDNLTTHGQLIVTNLLVDLYRPSYFTLSNYSDHLALLPESCALLTICYLNSLRSGERLSVESLRTMIHYAQLGETDWLHYHKKHKKMSESTFVQSQLMHFSRIVVYPVQGRVRLVVSNQSLSEGITETLQNLSQILNSSSESTKTTVPDYLVVMAIRPLSTIDFCILVLDPLQVQLLSEMKLLSSHHESRTRRYHRQRSNERSHVAPSPRALRTLTPTTGTGNHVNCSSSQSTSSSSNLQIDRSILFSVQSFHRKLNGGVLLPYSSTELRNVESRSCITGSGLTTTMTMADADSMTPNAPHVIEHRPRGPFQDQYNVAMYMLQRILSTGAKSKIEDFQAVDFRVLCPPDATFVSQTISEIVASGVISHLTSSPTTSSAAASPQEGRFNFTTSMYSEAERRVICCSPKDSGGFHAFLKEVESNQSTLYVIVAENGHLTNSIAHSHSHSGSESTSTNTSSTNNNTCVSDSQRLLCSFSNCILLYVSSHPYSLQTNRSLVSPSCEIHWPVNVPLTRDDMGLRFYSSGDYQSGLLKSLLNQPEHMVRFCEDHSFEEMFQNALINNCSSSLSFSDQVLTLRANLLLNQYAAAMLVALGQPGGRGRGAQASGGIPLPETQQLVNHLVLDPLSSPRGHGSMILVRSHDVKVGKQFYQKLKALRDALGLQFRFEVIFDDGSHLLSVSEHFMKRLAKWGATPTAKTKTAAVSGAGSPAEQPLEGRGEGEREGDGDRERGAPSYRRSRLQSDGSGKSCRSTGSGAGSSLGQTVGGDGGGLHSYKQLEHLPCVVVLAGSSRAGLSFPSSLHFVDLRLCYPTGHITRTCYEYDTSFFNGYYQSQRKASSSPPLAPAAAAIKREAQSRGSDQAEAMDTSVVCDDSDSEVFEVSGSTPAAAGIAATEGHDQSSLNAAARMNSSSSSSCDDRHSKASSHESPEPTLLDGSNSAHHLHHHHHQHHTVSGQTVEWRPMSSKSAEDGGSMMLRNSGVARKTPSDDLQSPQDHNNIHDYSGIVTVMIDPPSDNQQLYAESAAADDLGSKLVFRRPSASEEEDIDLFADLDDSDSEGEEAEGGTVLTKTCLLSRPYYHIWTSSNPQQNLLLLPAQGVTWYGGHKRPPLFDPDPQQQSMHYRKWTKPLNKEVRGQLDGIIRATNRSSRRSFLLSGPPQVGKTGAWLLMVRLLHSHLHSSQGVIVENPPAPSSIFVSPNNFKEETRHQLLRNEEGVVSIPQHSPTLALRSSKQSKIVSLECLERIAKLLALDAKNDSKSPKLITLNNSSSSPSHVQMTARPTHTHQQLGSPPLSQAAAATSAGGATTTRVHVTASDRASPSTSTISLPLSSYMTYDFTHSCSECSKHMRGNAIAQPEYFSSSLPLASNSTSTSADSASSQGHVSIKWFVPASQQKHCVISQDRKVLERLKLPTFKFKGEKASQPVTPIFTPTLGRDSSGLFNLFHSLPHHFHVLVTNLSEFKAYCKAWPNHIIMALPDQEVVGLGSTYHLLKQFVQYNYTLNVQSNPSLRIVWPLVAFISDSIVMWKKLHPSGRTTDVPLSEVLLVMEQSADSYDLVAMSAVPWSKQLEDGSGGSSTGEELTNYDLSHDFILLNLSKTSFFTYNQFSLNSAQVGFNLQLQAVEMKTKLFKEFAFVQKHLATGGNPYPCQGPNSTLVADIDKAVISLHHDSSSHLPYPGPYLMEHFLLYKSQVLFPYAQSPEFPVLIVDNYISLGPHTHVTFIQSMSLTSLDMQNSAVLSYKLDTLSRIRFSGLVLYLCEGKLSSEQLSRLNFVQGACLCLVTRDCKTLVREVARLDLEERWKFRLRDEYQTACADSMRPLFFLTGRFEG